MKISVRAGALVTSTTDLFEKAFTLQTSIGDGVSDNTRKQIFSNMSKHVDAANSNKLNAS